MWAIGDGGATTNFPTHFKSSLEASKFMNHRTTPRSPPSSLVALRFRRPSRIAFLRDGGDQSSLQEDWYLQLNNDRLEPLNVSQEEFALGNDGLFAELVGKSREEEVHFVGESGGSDVKLAFLASGGGGLSVEAAEVGIFLMTGEIDLEKFEKLHGDWWVYWKEYWRRKDTPNPMPKTMPAKSRFR